MAARRSILKLLAEGPVIGDGSYVITLEKRGYIRTRSWTPEVVVEHPYAVEQLHREYIWAGSDTIQAFTFYTTDKRLQQDTSVAKSYTCDEINQAACDIAKKIAGPAGALVCGGVSSSPYYSSGEGKAAVQEEFRAQTRVFMRNNVDWVLGEFFGHVEEAEWAIETLKETGLPVACTMRMGPTGDIDDVAPGDCAVRMAKAGADIIGLNCQYDPKILLKTMRLMKEGLDAAGLSAYLMMQPLGFHVPEVENWKGGYHDLPEYPFALEPRLLTRWDARRYAREAYDLGVRYFGGCCGFEPYHMREISDEIKGKVGKTYPGKVKHDNMGNRRIFPDNSDISDSQAIDFWMNHLPATGRPDNPAASHSIVENKVQFDSSKSSSNGF